MSTRSSRLVRQALLPLLVASAAASAAGGQVARDSAAPAAPAPRLVVRVNLLGWRPEDPRVAVACALDSAVTLEGFTVSDARGRLALRARPREGRAAGPLGPCVRTWRLDLGRLTSPGRYTLRVAGAADATVRIARDAYDGAADTLLRYLRQQRSGYNPVFRDSVHRHDGIVVDDSALGGKFVAVSGGWADAADYLQYVTTSATATFALLEAARDFPDAFADVVDARGLPGANGTRDALDEARHGLEWLDRMYPGGDVIFNQLGDDRDHAFWDLPTTDSSDYGWGKGGARPVYPCTGRPQGLFATRNRSTGYASTAGKVAAALALGAQLERDRARREQMAKKAAAAYALGRAHPGVCQTAPGRAPYFYEEENWTDDMELAGAVLRTLLGQDRYAHEALAWADSEPVTPWMGADTARHYEWYPWHNAGHFELWRALGPGRAGRARLAGYYRDGLARVERRAATNGFHVGIPFIWCSNDLMTSLATQALFYRRMTGDTRFRTLEQSALDWLLGVNPWGTSMVIGLPSWGPSPRDPHSVVAATLGVSALTGGLVDGPVYRSIYGNLRYISLHDADEYAPFNTGSIVYHDDIGDYSTNEPIMDGTANLVYLLASRSSRN